MVCIGLLFLATSAQPPKIRGRGSGSLLPLSAVGEGRPARSPIATCRRIEFRTLNGKCTSLSDEFLGQARLPQFSYIAGSSSDIPAGQKLRSTRDISNIVFKQSSNTVNSRGLNELFTFFGAFVVHSISASPPNTSESLPIAVPETDPDLDEAELPFLRSMRGVTTDGESQRAINSLPSAFDLSGVYGADDFRNQALLEKVNGKMTGKLKTSGDNLMPLNTEGLFNAPDTSANFFVTGDHRANEHTAIIAMHTIFVRNHNSLVDMMRKRIPDLPADRQYEYARKLNIAEFQKIIYEEFYPALIANNLPAYKGFRRNVDPTVSDIFVTAALRLGHTLVGNTLPRRGRMGPLPPIGGDNLFFPPASAFSSDEMDNIFRGLANGAAQEIDSQVVDLLRNFLFSNVQQEEGVDLVAINLQRGRDHSLPTFNEIRKIFNIPRAASFSHISKDSSVATRLAKAYNNKIDDVEAFVGLLAEDRVRGSGVGRTMEAVWRAEFIRLRDGDQFFYLSTRRFPRTLRTKFEDFVRTLIVPSTNTFRTVILRNTKVTADEMPTGNVFNFKI